MRNPKNSWDKSDSFFGTYSYYGGEESINEVINAWMEKKYPKLCEAIFNPDINDESLDCKTNYEYYNEKIDEYSEKMFDNCLLSPEHEFEDWTPVACIGPKDMELAQRLIKAGPEHRKFLRQIFVSVDITAPLYWY